jgi:hypothetical protein
LRKVLFALIFILMSYIFQADLKIDPSNKLAMFGLLVSHFFFLWNLVSFVWYDAKQFRNGRPKKPGEFAIRRNDS